MGQVGDINDRFLVSPSCHGLGLMIDRGRELKLTLLEAIQVVTI
jgi:hypothetical protein